VQPNQMKAIPEMAELPRELPTSRRTPYSTRYLHPDGSFTEEVFLQPRFFKNEQTNRWEEINNNLRESEEFPGHYVNNANDFLILFAEQAGGDHLVTILRENKGLTLNPVNAKAPFVKINEE
jgi:hypothetical protein